MTPQHGDGRGAHPGRNACTNTPLSDVRADLIKAATEAAVRARAVAQMQRYIAAGRVGYTEVAYGLLRDSESTAMWSARAAELAEVA